MLAQGWRVAVATSILPLADCYWAAHNIIKCRYRPSVQSLAVLSASQQQPQKHAALDTATVSTPASTHASQYEYSSVE